MLLIALKQDILMPPSRTNFNPRSIETMSVHQCKTCDVLRAQQPIFHRRPSQIVDAAHRRLERVDNDRIR